MTLDGCSRELRHYYACMSLEDCHSTFRRNSHCFHCWFQQTGLSGAQSLEALPYRLFSSSHALSSTESPSWVPDSWCEVSSVTDSLGSNYCFLFGLLTLWITQQFFMLMILTLRFKMCWLFVIANPAFPLHLLPFSAQSSASEALVGMYWGYLLAGFQFSSALEDTLPASVQSLMHLLHPSLMTASAGASSPARHRSVRFSDRRILLALLLVPAGGGAGFPLLLVPMKISLLEFLYSVTVVGFCFLILQVISNLLFVLLPLSLELYMGQPTDHLLSEPLQVFAKNANSGGLSQHHPSQNLGQTSGGQGTFISTSSWDGSWPHWDQRT